MPNADTLAAVGLEPDRWKAACQLIQGWCERGDIPAAGLIVGRGGETTGAELFGRQSVAENSPPIRKDAIFLIASITKPIVTTGIMLLVERGLLTVDDRVEAYIPEFGKNGKHAMTIRHLLTHPSGLPDMLDNNIELRQAGAPLSEFMAGAVASSPIFQPGQPVQ